MGSLEARGEGRAWELGSGPQASMACALTVWILQEPELCCLGQQVAMDKLGTPDPRGWWVSWRSQGCAQVGRTESSAG